MHRHPPITTHILLTGATGYIGGSVLTHLLSHRLSDTFRTTVLVRAISKATQFRTMGIHAVVGSYSDLDLLKQLASDADLVFACVDADDLDATNAILQGLKERHSKTGKTPSLIHTAPVMKYNLIMLTPSKMREFLVPGVLIDDARGMYPSDVIYSDLDTAKLEMLPDSQPHRLVDVAITRADKEGYVKSYIIAPGTVYGIARGALVDAGIQNNHSQQIPRLVRISIDRNHAAMVGQGKNIWPNVHIAELVDLYILLFDLVLGHHPEHVRTHASAFTHGSSGFYFAENGEHTLYEIAETIGHLMVEFHRTDDPTPKTLTEEELKKYFPDGANMTGTNSRCRAERSRAVGWKPKKSTKDMLASIKQEVKAAI